MLKCTTATRSSLSHSSLINKFCFKEIRTEVISRRSRCADMKKSISVHPFSLTTPCLVDDKFGRSVSHDEYARISPPTGRHSMFASLPIRLSRDKATATYWTPAEKRSCCDSQIRLLMMVWHLPAADFSSKRNFPPRTSTVVRPRQFCWLTQLLGSPKHVFVSPHPS